MMLTCQNRAADAVSVTITTPLVGRVVTVLLDRVDLPRFQAMTWSVGIDGILYHGRGKRRIVLSRLIVGAKTGECVYYKNGNRLDCRRENLHLADRTFTAKEGPGLWLVRGMVEGVLAPVAVRCEVENKGQRFQRRFGFAKYGPQEAMRRALAWRVQTYRQLGVVPPARLVTMLERASGMSRAPGGFEELYGGNADYENSVVVAREVAHWAQPWEEAA